MPSPTCINLRERYGRSYKVGYEESYYAQYGPRARVEDPWLQIIPCRAGHIFPHGGTKLAAVTNKLGPTARKLAAIPGVTLWQDGDDGVTVLFDVADFDRVAAIIGPKRRRKPLTEKQLQVLAAGRVLFVPKSVEKEAVNAAVCDGSPKVDIQDPSEPPNL